MAPSHQHAHEDQHIPAHQLPDAQADRDDKPAEGASVPQPDRKVTYKTINGSSLQLHAFEPDGYQAQSDKRGAIVFFHGGVWVKGSPVQFYAHCRHLADLGMVAYAADYRLAIAHQNEASVCPDDAAAAVRYMRLHADELGLDPDRIAVGGGSAGGHLAACTAYCDDLDPNTEHASVSYRPNALVLFNAIVDLSPDRPGHKKFREHWQHYSPIHHITRRDLPSIAFLGSDDSGIPVALAEGFRDLIRASGDQSELHIYEGRQHGFFNVGRNDNKDYEDTVEKMTAFLKKNGWFA